MKYHNITKDDMNNGEGIRVVLWLSGCEHHCKGCHNPETWNPSHGLDFDHQAFEEICQELDKDYVAGLTLSGGDPLHPFNRHAVDLLCTKVKCLYPNKNIWLYTGYRFEDVYPFLYNFLGEGDVVVDGKYNRNLPPAPWVGSNNQRVIRL